MTKMKELSLEIKGQDRDQFEDEKKDLGQKNKSELRQRFRLDSVMSSEELDKSEKHNEDSGSTDEYHISSQESE